MTRELLQTLLAKEPFQPTSGRRFLWLTISYKKSQVDRSHARFQREWGENQLMYDPALVLVAIGDVRKCWCRQH
jgi:hypothetical protein